MVAVMSKKGGVGKTSIAINIAYTIARKGMRVGLVDIDFHGPNLPIMLGIDSKPRVTPEGIEPVEVDGVKVMSLALLMRSDDDPCLWSSETKRIMVEQMFRSVLWGDIDVFVVDTPPSLGDENLYSASKADKIVLVSTPHPASIYDVRKMLRFLRDKVVAIVWNMWNLFADNNDAIDKLDFPSERQYIVEFIDEFKTNPRTPPMREVAWAAME